MGDITNIIYTEIIVLIIFSAIATISAVLYELFFKSYQKKLDHLRVLLTEFFSENIYGTDDLIPKSLQKLDLIVPVLEDLEREVSGIFWEYYKYWMIHHLAQDTLQVCLHARNWSDKILAIRALTLSPNVKYEEKILQLLQDKNPLVRYAAAFLAAKINTRNSIYAILEAMNKEHPTNQYPYMDPLIDSSKDTFAILLNIYEKENPPEIKRSSLKILAKKAGFLHFELLQQDLTSTNLESRWWAIYALKNSLSSNQVLETLLNCSKDPSWQVRALVMDIIGSLQLQSGMGILDSALNDDHFWVKISAGWALTNFGKKGLSLLNQRAETSQTAKYILSIPKSSIERNIDQFAIHFLSES